jgi:hypothetical protein
MKCRGAHLLLNLRKNLDEVQHQHIISDVSIDSHLRILMVAELSKLIFYVLYDVHYHKVLSPTEETKCGQSLCCPRNHHSIVSLL